MKKDILEYFKQECSKASLSVVPGHWPNFKTREDVDKWISTMKKIVGGI